jgi:hypothetical protein
VIAVDLDRLRALLDREPRLIHARSLHDHRATLLHYVAANGTERQVCPPNAPDVARLLLARGADPDALAMTYGGGPAQTPLYLAATSTIPEAAGVMTPLLEALIAGGARIEHEDREALHSSLPGALPVLLAAGAALDLWIAAALGRLADVRRFVRGDGTLAPGAKLGSEATTPDPVIVDRALLAACDAGHPEIVEVLAAAGARLDARDVQGMTGLHLAAWNDHAEVARSLVARGAPLDARNAYGGTVLGMLRWAIANDPRERRHTAELLELLERAGAGL